jgi:hypothetical protein
MLDLHCPPPPSLLLPYCPWLPKANPRNEVGVIVHADSKNVLGDHTGKNIYGNLNYAKLFIQGTFVNVFNRCVPGGKNE